MHFSKIGAIALSVAFVNGHGLVTFMKGSNGVTMPGLSVGEDVPRDCVVNACGAQADTAIIRDEEIRSGKVGPLGRTQGGSDIDADKAVRVFLGTAAKKSKRDLRPALDAVGDVKNTLNPSTAKQLAADVKGGSKATIERILKLVEQNHQKRDFRPVIDAIGDAKNTLNPSTAKQLAADVKGGSKATIDRILALANKSHEKRQVVDFSGFLQKSAPRVENDDGAVSNPMAGEGKGVGLPTCNDDNTVDFIYRQINQDGAGPLTCVVDATSGGKDISAFVPCKMVTNIPGIGISGLSLATNTNFATKVQIPENMVCEGEVGGVEGVCIVRVRNGATAGPFGGAVAFKQNKSNRALKRRNRKVRRFAREFV